MSLKDGRFEVGKFRAAQALRLAFMVKSVFLNEKALVTPFGEHNQLFENLWNDAGGFSLATKTS